MMQTNNGTALVPQQLSAFDIADRKRYEKLAAAPKFTSDKKMVYPDIPGTDDFLQSFYN